MHLDTHVAAWLFAGDLRRFPARARAALESRPLFLSPAVELELQYLFEIGRTTEPGALVVADLGARLGLCVAPEPFADVVAAALSLAWTRDPFDRLIVAHASLVGADLLTKDEHLRLRYPRAFWD